jgi:hypothetical protein
MVRLKLHVLYCKVMTQIDNKEFKKYIFENLDNTNYYIYFIFNFKMIF